MPISFNDLRPLLPGMGYRGSGFSSLVIATGSFTFNVSFSSAITEETASEVFSASSLGVNSKVICVSGFPIYVKVQWRVSL